jgi:RHS repeat-associated protein
MRRKLSLWLVLATLLGGLVWPTYAADPDVASPLTSYLYLDAFADPPSQPNVASTLVSYLYQDSLATPPGQPNVVSPLVSYQYYDSLGEPGSLLFSPLVSYEFDLPSVGAIWILPPPSAVWAGETFQVAWAASNRPTHVNVHWDPNDPKALTASQTVAGSTRDSTVSPTTSPAVLTAPVKNPDGTPITVPTTVYYVVHVASAQGDGYSTVVPVTVNPACGAPSPTPIALGLGDFPTSGCLSKGQVQVYTFAAQASQLYSILLRPSSGDPDLYASASQACINQVPAPSGCSFSKSTNPGLLVDSLGVMAAGTGTYYLAVYGYKDTIYTIQAVGNKPLAKFDANSNAPHSGEPVAFTAAASRGSSTTCAIAAYAWNFGDGGTATGVSPTHVFTPTGTATYTVQLTVTDCNGQTDSKTMPITVTGLALSRNNQTSFSKDPVNLATGNYAYEHVDLRIPGRGIPFEFKRAYNSRANQFNGAGLGPGWTHSYHVTVTGDPAVGLAVLWGTGNIEIYTHNADGSYAAEAGVFNVLVNNGDGTFTLTTKDQVRYSFDVLGRLPTITDKNGNALSLNYDASGNLDSITDTAGRTIDFVSDANNRITQIIDPLGRKVEFSYDASGDLVSAKDPVSGTTSYSYDGLHEMTSATDPKGQPFVSNVYDAQSRVVQAQADALGNQTTFSYDFQTRVTTVTDALGNQSVYYHDAQLRVAAIKDGLGNVQIFEYDANNNRTRIVDKRGFATSYNYDTRGNVIQKLDALSNQTLIDYDARNNPTTRTDALGNVTGYAYDAKGNLTQTTDPLGKVSSISYDGFGEAVSVTDANGKVTANTFDAQGNLVQTQDPLGNATSFTYDAVGRRLTRVDANGHTTTYSYDANGNLMTVIDPLGHTATYAYDANNNQVSTTDALGGVTTSAYDAKDRLISVQNALGGTTAYQYDALDRKTRTTDPRGGVTLFAYDAVGNLIQVTDALGHVTHYACDANGNQTASTDPLSHTTSTLYDALNRRIQVADALGNTTQYTYDPVGRRIQTTDADGKVTQFGYDALGRLTQVTDANNGIVTYAYDAVGNRTAVIDPNGHSTTYQFDAANRLVQKTEPSGGVYQYGYDGAGNRTSQLDPNGNTISYPYDGNNRLTGVTYPSGSPVAFTYDANGNRTAMTDGLGHASFEYDALNRMTSCTDAYGMTVSYAYDANGNRSSLTYPGNKTVSYAYDALNRLVSASDWLNGVTAYTYDAAGNLVHTTNPNATTASYTFDSANRLTGLINAKADASLISSYSLTLDGVGNHLQSAQQEPLTPAIPNQTTAYAYDNDNRLTSAGATAFTYDANGNMTAKGADTLAYDFENRLTQASVGGVSYQYQYDGLGNRFRRTVNGVSQRFVLDVNGRMSHVLAETDGSGTIAAYYVYGLGLISRITPSGTVAYYHYDVRGSTVALSDSTGALTDKYAYDPFGQLGNSRGASANSFRYLGRYRVMDEGNGLAFARARYFSPEHGRFVTKDPVTGKDGDSQSLHRYLYALNNPVRLIDISGFSPLDAVNQPNLNGTSDQRHYPLVESHRLTKEQVARIVQAQQEALQYQLQAINYEAEANILQGVYDALQTTQSLLTGDVIGVGTGLARQASTLLSIEGQGDISNAINFSANILDVANAAKGVYDAASAGGRIASALTGEGQNLMKDVGFSALLLDVSNPVAEAYSNLVMPTLDFIFIHIENPCPHSISFIHIAAWGERNGCYGVVFLRLSPPRDYRQLRQRCHHQVHLRRLGQPADCSIVR